MHLLFPLKARFGKPLGSGRTSGWLAVLAMLLLAPPAQAQFTVSGLAPARNQKSAPAASNVGVTFNQNLNPATADSIRLFSAQRGGQLVRAGSAVVTTSGATLTVNPTTDLRPGETVFGTVRASVKAVGGDPAVPHVFQFTAATGGTGRGNFPMNADVVTSAAATDYAPGVAVADVDGDGDLDLLSTSFASAQVGIAKNNGAGTFSTPQYVSVDAEPGRVVMGDLDNDGDLDLLTTHFDARTVSVRFNDGTGNFSGTTNLPVEYGPISAALGDVDGDGDLDLLVANSSSNTVSIRFNNGRGSFSGTTNMGVSAGPSAIVLGDVDGDGDVDFLTTTTATGTTSASLGLNNGSGSFALAPGIVLGERTAGLALGDVDGDGDLDLVAAKYLVDKLSVAFNNGSGTFSTAPTVPDVNVGDRPSYVVLADVDADGDLDALVANVDDNTISTRFNDGTGTFSGTSRVTVAAGPRQVAVGDVDGDGDVDLIVGHGGANKVAIRPNRKPAPFISSSSAPGGVQGTSITLTGTGFEDITHLSYYSGFASLPFTLNSPTSLTFTMPSGVTAAGDYEPRLSLIISSLNGLSNSIQLTVYTPPYALHLTNGTVAENTGANVVAGTLVTADRDVDDTYTYTLVSGAGSTDNALVNINGNELRITASPDYETRTSYAVRVRTTEQTGFFIEQNFTLTVTDVREAPSTPTLSGRTVVENTGDNVGIATFAATDQDAGSSITFSLVSGVGDNALLNLSGIILRITTSPDYETKSSYTGLLRATDNTGLFTDLAFTITVLDAGPPQFTALTPTVAPTGATLTFTGVNLYGVTSITFTGASNNVVTSGYALAFNSSTVLTGVVVPTGATTGPVTITTPEGTSNALVFTLPHFVPLGLGGLTDDVIAEGVSRPATDVTTHDIDGNGYVLMTQGYSTGSGNTATVGLPANGYLTGSLGSGYAMPQVPYQLAPYGAKNTLRLTGTNGAVLTLAPSVATTNLYLLATSGGGSSTFTATVLYASGSPQTFTGLTAPDWYNGAGYVVTGIGRAQRGQANVDNNFGNPQLYQVALLGLDPSRLVVSCQIVRTGGGGILHVLAATATATTSRLTAVVPAVSAPGGLLTLTGYGLQGATLVTFAGGLTAFPTSINTPGTALTVVVPAGAVSGNVQVTLPSTVTNSVALTIGNFLAAGVTGFNADVVADGVGRAIDRTSNPFDDDNHSHVLMAAGYDNAAGGFASRGLPEGRTFVSAATADLPFVLAPYDGANSLRLTGTNSGTLTLDRPVPVAQLRVLAATGDGSSTLSVTVNFAGGGAETVTGVAVPDWYDNGPVAIQGLGRADRGNNSIDNDATNPKLFELLVALSAANSGKIVSSVSFSKTNGNGTINVMALSVGKAMELISSVPFRHQSAVPAGGNLTLTFDRQPLNAASGGTVRLHSARRGQLVRAGTATFSALNATLTIDPATDFLAGEPLALTVPNTVRAASGAGAAPQVLAFRAAVAPASPGLFPGAGTATVYNTNNASASNFKVGDLNGDGKQDVVWATSDGPLKACLSDGTGAFGTAVAISPLYTNRIAIGDIDNDGDLDLIALRRALTYATDSLIVLRNSGTGTFSRVSSQFVGGGSDLLLGDVDADGDLDLIVTGGSISTLVRLNNGSGAFSGTGSVGGTYVALQDVDNDGDLDLIGYGGSDVVVSRNTGAGTFGAPGVVVSVAGTIMSIQLADIDNNSTLDLLVNQGREVAVYAKQNPGGYVLRSTLLEAVTLTVITLGDVDGDGDLDLLGRRNSATGSVAVRLNDGAGTFNGGARNPLVPSAPINLELVDMDGDRDLDVVTFDGSSIYVRFNFAPPPFLTSLSPSEGAVGATVQLTGIDFTDATSVSFGGTAATFVVNSGSTITATVPAGALPGNVTVTTAFGTSNGQYFAVGGNLTGLTGFNADVIAEGTGPVSDHTTAPFDAATANLMVLGYNNGRADLGDTYLATYGLPVVGVLPASSSTFGLAYQLAPYTSNNALRLTTGAPGGTLTLTTPRQTARIGVLVAAADGDGTIDVLLNFADGTTETILGRTVNNWTGPASGISRLGKVAVVNSAIANTLSAPKLYEVLLGVGAANQHKALASVTFTKTSTGPEIVEVLALTFGASAQGALVAVPVTGFTFDLIAEGTGSVQSVTTQVFDPGRNAVLMAAGYSNGAATTTRGLPANGQVTSAYIGGLTYQLAAYAGKNAIISDGTNTYQPLTLTTPVAATEVYLLNASGSGLGLLAVEVKVEFDDATSETFSDGFRNWYSSGGAPFAIKALGRADRQNNTILDDATYAQLYDMRLVLSAANAGKVVTRILVRNTRPVGFANTLAVVLSIPRPTLTSLSPANGLAGTAVTITGTGFKGATAVRFNGTPTPFSIASATSITTTVPAGATTGFVTVTGPGGTSDGLLITVPTSSTITALSPASGPEGTEVTLTGTGFTTATAVSFGGTPAASFTVVNATTVRATVAVGTVSGSTASVVTTTGTSSSTAAFTVLAIYDGPANQCRPLTPITSTGTGQWQWLRDAATGELAVGFNDQGQALGQVGGEVYRATGAVRADGRGQEYLNRNWHLTAQNAFAGHTVRVRFYALNSEFAAYAAANDGDATDANVLTALRLTQYAGPAADCDLTNNPASGTSRLLTPAAPENLDGANWFGLETPVADHFSEFYAHGSAQGGVLPVTLTTFAAQRTGATTTVGLTWHTAQERQNAGFVVERSADGRTFAAVSARIAGAGTSPAPHTYAFSDATAPATALYYRLRQEDFDGTAHYSAVVAVNAATATFAVVSAPALWPNPVLAGQVVRLSGCAPGAHLLLTDLAGRHLATTTATAHGTAQLPLAGVAKGTYLVRVVNGPATRLVVE